MASRSNACSELTRFWLEARHGCLITESVPVPVPYGQSDIDFVAMKPKLDTMSLPDGSIVGPRLIVETKDEHDFDPKGKEFGKYLRSDVALLGTNLFIPRAPITKAKFSMLREAHFDVATQFFGVSDFDRLFVIHALDPLVRTEFAPLFTELKIHWLTIPELVQDLRHWYATHPRPSGLRHTLVGDLWHLLVGYCGYNSTT